MILDSQLEFSSAQAITSSAASTNQVDLKVANARVGAGEPLFIRVGCTTAMTDGSSDSTVTVTLQQDDNSSFSSATNVQTLCTFAATAAAGTEYVAAIYPEVVTERYIRVYYTVATGDLSTGAFDAHLLHGPETYRAYADSARRSVL